MGRAGAPSQVEFLVALRSEKSVEWSRVNSFHIDEYLGLPDAASQRFGNFLKERIFDHLPFCSVHYIQGGASDPLAECARYEALLKEFPPHVICMGIGENGRIAFNYQHVADFNNSKCVKVVDLYHVCRPNRVNDDLFCKTEKVHR